MSLYDKWRKDKIREIEFWSAAVLLPVIVLASLQFAEQDGKTIGERKGKNDLACADHFVLHADTIKPKFTKQVGADNPNPQVVVQVKTPSGYETKCVFTPPEPGGQ